MTAHLLDTHTMIWWWTDNPRLSMSARAAILGGEAVHVSAASVWEIAIKAHRGKLPEIADFPSDYPRLMERDGFARLVVTDAHAMRAGYLPGVHADPFDRLIAAQALDEDLVVVTRDPAMASLGCATLW